MLARHRISGEELFSFIDRGRASYSFEWLSEVAFGALHQAWGLKGVVLMTGLIIAATVTLLFRWMLARGANPLIALAMTLLATNAMNISFMARPHIFTLALLTITAWLVDADRRCRADPLIYAARSRAAGRKAVWLVPALAVIWTNLHGGVFILFPFLGLLVAGSLIEGLLSPDLRRLRLSDAGRYAAVLGACVAGSLVNPYGAGFHVAVFSYLGDPFIGSYVSEFQSPSFRSEALMTYMVTLFLALGVGGILLARRRITEPLWVAFFAYCSLTSVRHVPLLLIIAAPIVAQELTERWSQTTAGLPRRSAARIIDDIGRCFGVAAERSSVWIPIAILVLCVAPGLAWPADFPHHVFPAAIVARHADLIAASRVYCSDQWSDYLIYRNYPRQRVFMSDRHQQYGTKPRNAYLALLEGRRNWKAILDEYKIDTVLCPLDAPLASVLRERTDWRLEDEDKLAVLFVRRPPT